jgi:hypothetical protein
LKLLKIIGIERNSKNMFMSFTMCNLTFLAEERRDERRRRRRRRSKRSAIAKSCTTVF